MIMDKKYNFGNIKRLGAVLIISGPSGAGKSTICKCVMSNDSNLVFSISCTTRQPRKGEIDGIDYNFVSIEKFESLISNDAFIEYANVHGNYYGTLKSEIYRRIENGQDVLLDIDVQGALKIKESAADDEMLKKCTEYVFVAPPNGQVLEARLRGRQTDAENVIQKRLANSLKEIEMFSEYDYLIINDNVENAVKEFQSVLAALRNKIIRFVSF
jgi:guanylate kinase